MQYHVFDHVKVCVVHLEQYVQYGAVEKLNQKKPGPHNLRSFLTANSTQNYFLTARILSFL